MVRVYTKHSEKVVLPRGMRRARLHTPLPLSLHMFTSEHRPSAELDVTFLTCDYSPV